jgi:membrane protein
VAHAAGSFVVITLVFVVMFRYLPDAEISWSDVAFGAVFTALLFVGGKYAMGAYPGSRNLQTAYGAAGSLVLILLWIYYSAVILLFGAELTQVWARLKGQGIKPADGAIQVE